MLGFFKDMTPWTKRMIIACITLIVIASMVYGYFGDIVSLFGDGKVTPTFINPK